MLQKKFGLYLPCVGEGKGREGIINVDDMGGGYGKLSCEGPGNNNLFRDFCNYGGEYGKGCPLRTSNLSPAVKKKRR